MYKLDYSFDNIDCLDIYKVIQPFHSLIKTPNLKQKSLELFLGINREDKYSGGELIEIYLKYLNTRSNDLMNLLTLHNHDDLIGMTKLLSMLSYQAAYNGQMNVQSIASDTYTLPEGTDGKEITFNMLLSLPVPVFYNIITDK